ncbi:MAG: ABC transporter family protein, partial [Alphaproteobacteria bacterium]
DLDMDTLDMLQELLADYNGTLILVSHDRDFLDRTVTEVLAFEGDGIIHNHIGGYTDYLAARKTIERDEKKKAAQQNVGNDNHFQTIIQPPKKLEKMSFKLRYELEQLPQKIGQRELEIENLKKQLADPAFYSKNPTDFAEKSQRLGEAMIELDGLETRWLELSEMAAQEVASK